jgi:ActR/RegA family two-component response regulator
VKGGIAPAPGAGGPRPPSGVSDSLSRIINSGAAGELVGMMDGLVKQLDAAGIGADERGRKMSQLFKLLPVAEQVQRLRPVLVVQEEADVLQRWIASLDEAGYEAEGRPNIATAMEALRGDTPWCAVVVDLGFRAAEATDFLAELGAAEKPTPLILTAWDEAVKEADAVQAHPALKFLPNPVEADVLVHALDEIVPPPEIPKPTADEIAIDPKLARELERANEIQAGLLPKEVAQVPGYEIAGQYLPAEHVGGDYWDVIPLRDGRIGMLVADVSGKGISAAMVMVMARTVFHAIAPTHPVAQDCVIEAASRIAADLPGGTFVTLCYAVLDPATGDVSVANCGHIPPLHWSRLEGRPFVSTVDSAGGAIGLVKGDLFARTLRDGAVRLGPEESLVFFTDGVNEAMSEAGEEFGDKQVHRTVKKNGAGSAAELAQALVDAVLYHRGDAPASDDVTVLVLKRGPKGPEAWEEPIELS